MTSSASEYLFLSSALFASFNGRSLPRHGICKPECTVLPLILIAARPVGANSKTVGLAGSPSRYKNTLFTASNIFLLKSNLLHPRLPKKNRWNGDDSFKVIPHLTLTCNLAQLYIKSNICLSLRFRDPILLLISLSLRMVVWSSEGTVSE